jgi:ABC-type sugar transport system permease subunit
MREKRHSVWNTLLWVAFAAIAMTIACVVLAFSIDSEDNTTVDGFSSGVELKHG